MNISLNTTLATKVSFNILIISILIGTGELKSELITNTGDNPANQKSIFVFLDGTGNDKSTKTNIWNLFKLIEKHKNHQTVTHYIEGVGSVNEPLEDDPILAVFGDALGRGMQDRILKGYDFIAANYNPGDEIFIFGFSRGAHQARALAGLLSYAGVPTNLIRDDDERKMKFEHILNLLKEIRDEDFKDQWKNWKPNQDPLLAEAIKADNHIFLDMQPVEIKFLGIWDTVPGSSFKNYDACKEHIGFLKRYFHLLPGISKGERYKSDSYPPIRQIAHAVSLDEKRSKFAPLYLCDALVKDYTILDETWFPGAHADVGGGYGDDDLPNISLNWMIGLLERNYSFSSKPDRNAIKGNVKGLTHWSFGDRPANMGSECEDRLNREDRQPPLGFNPHPSIDEREQAGIVPILIKGIKNEHDWRYPILCPGPGK